MTELKLCPLCEADGAGIFFEDPTRKREFFLCEACGLVFVPTEHHPSVEDEKRRYDLHQNHPSDTGYQNHLRRLFDPLNGRLAPSSRGLDFGSGPGPVLSRMFEAAGHPMEIYDPFYAPDPAVLGRTYDFVTAAEVAEHLRRPAETLDQVWGLVRPGGWLGVMTQSRPADGHFAKWGYKNDVTHLLFFSPGVFDRLAARWNAAQTVFACSGVTLFQKSK